MDPDLRQEIADKVSKDIEKVMELAKCRRYFAARGYRLAKFNIEAAVRIAKEEMNTSGYTFLES